MSYRIALVLGALVVAVGLSVGPASTQNVTVSPTVNATSVPTTSGGLSVFSAIVANNTTSVAVKATAGQIYGIDAYSISSTATAAWLKIYNATQGSTTCGSGTPVARILIPATGASGSGQVWHDPNGDAYSTAITYCVTTGIADNDTTAPAASSYVVNFHYK